MLPFKWFVVASVLAASIIGVSLLVDLSKGHHREVDAIPSRLTAPTLAELSKDSLFDGNGWNGDEANLRPGLEATYYSLRSNHRAVSQIDTKPSFNWGISSPHPFFTREPFGVTWKGFLIVRESDSFRFQAFVTGFAKVTVDGVTVIDGRGEHQTSMLESSQPWKRGPGVYPISVDYRSLDDMNVPSR